MQINFFSQPYLLYIYEITKVNGSRNSYLLLGYDTPTKVEELVMVGSIKNESYGFFIHREVYL